MEKKSNLIINFYKSQDINLLANVYSLVKKTIDINEKLLILVNNNNTKTLSEYIWSKESETFWAHGINDDDGQEFSKIWISDDNTKNQISAKYICCLDGILPKNISCFKKAFKFYVDGNETQTLIAREFWKLCSEKNYNCNHFYQDYSGKWHPNEFN